VRAAAQMTGNKRKRRDDDDDDDFPATDLENRFFFSFRIRRRALCHILRIMYMCIYIIIMHAVRSIITIIIIIIMFERRLRRVHIIIRTCVCVYLLYFSY